MTSMLCDVRSRQVKVAPYLARRPPEPPWQRGFAADSCFAIKGAFIGEMPRANAAQAMQGCEFRLMAPLEGDDLSDRTANVARALRDGITRLCHRIISDQGRSEAFDRINPQRF